MCMCEQASNLIDLQQQVARVQSQYDQLKSDLEKSRSEEHQERDSRLTQISELERKLSMVQEECAVRIAEVEKNAETRVSSLKQKLQKKLEDKQKDIDSQLLQVQLELEQKYAQEKAELLANQHMLKDGHEQELRNVEERYSFEIADLKRTLKSMRAESQEARDNHLAESEKASRFEKQLLELQAGHQLELEALKAEHQQELEQMASLRQQNGGEEREGERESVVSRQRREEVVAALKKEHEGEIVEMRERIEEMERTCEEVPKYQSTIARYVYCVYVRLTTFTVHCLCY